jgi:hypothetical protein
MCFMDRTFCMSKDCKGDCGRQWTQELQEQAEKWWNPEGLPELRDQAPVAFGYFCGGVNGYPNTNERSAATMGVFTGEGGTPSTEPEQSEERTA